MVDFSRFFLGGGGGGISHVLLGFYCEKVRGCKKYEWF